MKKEKLEMAIVKQGESSGPLATASFLSPAPAKNTPFCKFVNAVLVGMPSQEGVEGNQATVLLENPTGNGFKDLQQLIDQVRSPSVTTAFRSIKEISSSVLMHFDVLMILDKY